MSEISLRVGDAERNKVVESLREWYASGHLDTDELNTRIDLALKSKTVAELSIVTTGLPVPEDKHGHFTTSTIPGSLLLVASALTGTAIPVYMLSGANVTRLELMIAIGAIALAIALFVVTCIAWTRAHDQRILDQRERERAHALRERELNDRMRYLP